ncbi:MAG: cupin domain-containing protein [Nannocystales bacterium]
MEHNADFAQRVWSHDRDTTWLPSPMPGVTRRVLDRIGSEVARATSVVRYAPGSSFSRHTHTGGEEFLVLDGVFSDEHGDFGPGSYLRNPPGSSHQPGSEPGCTILVKLWQFDLDDRTPVRRIATDAFVGGLEAGVSVQALHEDETERVRLERWHAGACIDREAPAGLELFVLQGGFEVDTERFEARSWLRIPPAERFRATVGKGGATLWLKAGHLRDARARFEDAFVRAQL